MIKNRKATGVERQVFETHKTGLQHKQCLKKGYQKTLSTRESVPGQLGQSNSEHTGNLLSNSSII